jgi:nucleoside 2-deoxyribosyltransferase
VNHILENEQLPTPGEQADNLILWLGENLPGPGHSLPLSQKQCQSIMGAKDLEGAGFVLEDLFNKELLDGTQETITLASAGWDRFYELERAISDSRKAFMAMKFGDAKLDKFCRECVKPAVEQTGFQLVRVDWEPKEGPIDNRIMVEIRTSRFLLADLTHNNQGVYWEAGFAKGLGKPVFYTCERSYFDQNRVHFDIRQHYTVLWEEGKLDEAAEQLKAAIRNTLPTEAKMEDDEKAG